MSVVAEFTVPADEFLLGETLQTIPETRVEIERVVAEDQRVTPYFWASGVDFDDFEAVMDDDPSVESVATLENHAESRFYRAVWNESSPGVTYAIEDTDATILSATGRDDAWSIRILFPDDGAISSFHTFCRSYDLSFELTRLYESRHPEAVGKYDLTEKQREALVAAREAGYFAVPRRIRLEQLAERLDISPNALSARLRRGHANLVDNTLRHADESLPAPSPQSETDT